MKLFKLSYYQQDLPENGRILVAPLHWGIGHATRCIPIIRQLLDLGYQPVIASDGAALFLLQNLFPELENYPLPAYKIRYTKRARFLKWRLLLQFPHFYKTYRQEQNFVTDLIQNKKIDAIISDNRFGVYSKEVTSIYITHQLRVKSGVTTPLTSMLHQYIINKFDKIWVPDVPENPSLSGLLSHSIRINTPVTYIGHLSQFQYELLPKKYDILVLLSGPEPQRSLLEILLFKLLKHSDNKICFVRGKVSGVEETKEQNNITVYNYLLGDSLQKLINQSALIIARSGYSTIMDLAVLHKKAFFIPTPGQAEQLYLAKHLERQKIAPFSYQDNFTLSQLETLKNYTGFL